MRTQTKILAWACGAIATAIVGVLAIEFLDGSGIHLAAYAHRGGEYLLGAVREYDGANALQAKADFEKCEGGNNTAISSAKSDLRKVKQAYNDCHDQHYEDSMGLAMCAEADRAVLAVQARLNAIKNAIKVNPCKAPA